VRRNPSTDIGVVVKDSSFGTGYACRQPAREAAP